MRSNALFYLALAVNAITLLVTISSVFTMFEPTQNLDGNFNGGNISDGMTAFGRLMTIPCLSIGREQIVLHLLIEEIDGKHTTRNLRFINQNCPHSFLNFPTNTFPEGIVAVKK